MKRVLNHTLCHGISFAIMAMITVGTMKIFGIDETKVNGLLIWVVHSLASGLVTELIIGYREEYGKTTNNA